MNDYERVRQVIQYVESRYRDQPGLSELAEVAGLSRYHFHRLFSRWAGVTPKAFVKFVTLSHARRLLRESRSVLDTSLECGLSGPGRLHDLFVTVESVTPGQFKAFGEGIQVRYGFHDSPFGTCLIGLTEKGICHLAFCDPRDGSSALEELAGAWKQAVLRHDPHGASRMCERIFGGREGSGNLRLFMTGTPFQLKVWEALLRIPSGHVLSYADVAKWIGRPKAARAVGSAVSGNPIAYIIPCHRVIRGSGVIHEYRWGSERKRAILAWESARSSGTHRPN